MSTIARRGTVGLAVAVAVLGLAPAAQAAVASVFTGMPSPPVTCTVRSGGATDGQRWCSGVSTRVRSWDGTPIDVAVFIPPEPNSGPDGGFPLIGLYHGWAGAKAGQSAAQRWLRQGYAVFSMTDRGWHESCGTVASRAGLPAWADCSDGTVDAIDTRYEARDAQYLIGHLVDEGLVDPDRIGAFGSSYGGMMASTLGALNSRTVLPDGTYTRWRSPDGIPLHIAAAAPSTLAADIIYTQMPNGSTLDYVADAPYFGPDGDARVGVQKAGVMNGFLLGPSASLVGNIGPDLLALGDGANGPGPYDAMKPLLREALRTHGAYNVVDASVAPAPMIIGDGWNDDFVGGDESIKLYNKIRALHPDVPVSMFFGDFGHPRSQDKDSFFASLREAWMNYYVRDARTGTRPPENVVMTGFTCPASTPSSGPFTIDRWADASAGEVRVRSIEPETIRASGSRDGATFFGDTTTACATAPAADNPASANYRTDPATGSGYDIRGSATLLMRLDVSGRSDQLAARLLDVGPDGRETLVERGLLRPRVGMPDLVQVLQLHPSMWHVAAGHSLKLELLADDAPYSHVNVSDAGDAAAQHPIVVRAIELRVPTVQGAGVAGVVTAPKPRYLPPGYTAAPGFRSLTTRRAPDFDPPRARVKRIEVGKLKRGKRKRKRGARVTVKLGGNDRGGSGIASYECRLDKGRWRRCNSPVRYRRVGRGKHRFRVYAIDAEGNEQRKPTVKRFRVKARKRRR